MFSGYGSSAMATANNSASIVVRGVLGNVTTGAIWTVIDVINGNFISPIMSRALSGFGFVGQLATTTYRNMVQIAKINVWNQLGSK